MDNTFETWVRDKIRFLAIRKDKGFHIIDQQGNNYGTYRSVDDFKKKEDSPIGRVNDIVIKSVF